MSSRDEDSGRSRLFDGPEWLGYPHDGQEPVSLRDYLDARPKDSSTRYLAASYQSLLTFGLLEAVMEAPVAEEMLLEKNRSGKLVMTTDRLVDVVRSWLSRIEESQPERLRTWFQRARANLSLAHSFMVSFTTMRFSIFEPLGDDMPSMVCFIAIIAEALVNAHARLIVGSPTPKEGFSWSMIWTPPIRESLRREIHNKGWCPSTIEYLVSTRTVSSLRYACEQGPLNDGKNHLACTPQCCAAYDIDTRTYVPKHDSTCGSTLEGSSTSCKYCMPALEQVIAYIKDDHVPVFTFGSSGLEVHTSSDMPYIALSHVWADGLGSTSEDGLAMCQLKRLSALISTLRPTDLSTIKLSKLGTLP